MKKSFLLWTVLCVGIAIECCNHEACDIAKKDFLKLVDEKGDGSTQECVYQMISADVSEQDDPAELSVELQRIKENIAALEKNEAKYASCLESLRGLNVKAILEIRRDMMERKMQEYALNIKPAEKNRI